ncbi:MAG: hypothetical protein O3B90_00435 [Actinomycetota bacterium]|nr:hypothetical protein [Actinomycetota bacterium]
MTRRVHSERWIYESPWDTLALTSAITLGVISGPELTLNGSSSVIL